MFLICVSLTQKKKTVALPNLCCDKSVGQCSCLGLPCPPLWGHSTLLASYTCLRTAELGSKDTTPRRNSLAEDGSQQPYPPVLGLQVSCGRLEFFGGWEIFFFLLSFPTFTPKHTEACLIQYYAMDLYKNSLSISHTIFFNAVYSPVNNLCKI